MDDNTTAVLTSLIEIGGISSVFWALAMLVRWIPPEIVAESDEEGDEEGEDDDAPDDDQEEDEAEPKADKQTCPSVLHCPYRADIQLTYGLHDRTIYDTVLWYIIIAVGGAATGFIVGVWFIRYSPWF